MGETLDESVLHGVDASGHDDRNGVRRRLRGDHRRISAARDDDVDLVIEKRSAARNASMNGAADAADPSASQPIRQVFVACASALSGAKVSARMTSEAKA